MYHVNDIYNLLDEKKSNLLSSYINSENFSQNLSSKQDKINNIILNYTKEKKTLFENKEITQKKQLKLSYQFKSIILLRNIRSKFGLEGLNKSKINQKDLESFETILSNVNEILKSWDGDLYFVYLPRHSDHYNLGKFQFLSLKKTHEHRKQVLNVVNKLDIPIIDLVTLLFSKHPDPLSLFPFRMFGHYNAEGYKQVSKIILENLNK